MNEEDDSSEDREEDTEYAADIADTDFSRQTIISMFRMGIPSSA